MNKKDVSERDICMKVITPSLVAAGWDVTSQVREEVHLTAEQVIVRAGLVIRRGESKFADFSLHFKPNIPLAVVEARDNKPRVRGDVQKRSTHRCARTGPAGYPKMRHVISAPLSHKTDGKNSTASRCTWTSFGTKRRISGVTNEL